MMMIYEYIMKIPNCSSQFRVLDSSQCLLFDILWLCCDGVVGDLLLNFVNT